jgi:hypothetical protein
VAQEFNASVPSPARIWNYWVGGKDNFAADRAVGDKVREIVPYVPIVARMTRQFLLRTVTMLASEYGIRQFIDIGSGLPTAQNTHEVAQAVAPQSRVVYVDNDPQVILHARSLLTSTSEGQVDCFLADLRDTETILSQAAKTLDFFRPVAVLLLQVLHFIPESDDPYAIVRRLMEPLVPGSYLVLVHGASDNEEDVSNETMARYNQMSPAPITLRRRDQVARFFDGLEPVGPGLTLGTEWLTVTGEPGPDTGISFGHNGVARKP